MDDAAIILEQVKATIDYVKYLSALSTGAMVFMIAFVKDVFPDPALINVLLASLTLFGGTVLSSIVYITFALWEDWRKPKPELNWVSIVQGLALIFAWLFFLGGVGTLLAFAFENFLEL